MRPESGPLPASDRGQIPEPARQALQSAIGSEPEAPSMALDAQDIELCGDMNSQAAPLPWPDHSELAPLERAWFTPLVFLGRRCLALLRFPMHLLGVGMFAYIFAFNLSVVRGKSMSPGIFDGDRILVDQFSYLFSDIERGDIIVLQYPLNPKLDYIKRVVGLPGDEILMSAGELYINGSLVPESYLLERDPYTDLRLTVKPGNYFVLGDNRLHSSDSREFGQVKAAFVRGKVDLRLWPLERIGRIR